MITSKDLEGSIYAHIYFRNLPDKSVEFFWYIFKDSIISIVDRLKTLDNNKKEECNCDIDYNKIIIELEKKSNLLNDLQKNEKYEEIKIEIEKYIRAISRYLFIKINDDYSYNIYLTNIKRWSRWVLDEKNNKLNFNWMNSYDKDDLFLTFFNIKKYIIEHSNKLKKTKLDKLDNQENILSILGIIHELVKKYHYKYEDKDEDKHKEEDIIQLNKDILEKIYNVIFDNKIYKYFPTILSILSKYFNVIEDLKNKGLIDNNINNNYSIEKIFTKILN